MKTLQSLFVVGLVLASSVAASAGISAQAWLETYYLDPQPAELPRAITALSREGYFDKPGHTAIAIGFLGTVFAQNPDRVDGWLKQIPALPVRHQRLVASALWQAGHPLGAQMMTALSADAENRADVLRLAQRSSNSVDETPVFSPSSMNLQWGAFLATGSERYVVNILNAVGVGQPGLDTAARIALAQHAAAHPAVLAICRTQLERQPSEVREVLRAAVNAASARPGS